MISPIAKPHGIAVAELLNLLGGSGLRLASKATALRLPLTSPTLFDPWTPPTGPRTGILLAIGLHPAAPGAADVVREAARLGFGAVVVKSLSLSVETLTAVAEAEGIALLVVDDEIEWRQLDALINSALTTATEANSSFSVPAVGDLFALANAIAAMVGGATAIEDMQEHVLAYSTLPGQPIDDDRRIGILGRKVPEFPDDEEQYAALFKATGVVRLPSVPPGLPRLAVAVRAGGQPLGSIWVVDAADDLDADAARALERSADIAALHMLRARSTMDLARQQRAELLRRLLEGGDGSQLVASELRLDPAGPYLVLAFQPPLETTGDELRMVRLTDLIATQCGAHQYGAECGVIGNTVYALFTGAAGCEPGAAKALAQRLIARAASALGVQMHASIGPTVTTVGQISHARHEADLVLLMLGNSPATAAVASADDFRSRISLLELAQVFQKRPHLMSHHALKIVELDRRTGTEYAKTLLTYLNCGRDSAAASTALNLHPNTLRYRLRRLKELFGLDLGNPDDSLAVWLGLSVNQLR